MESKRQAAEASAMSPYTYLEIVNPSGSGKDTNISQHVKYYNNGNPQSIVNIKGYDRSVKGNVFSMTKPSLKSFLAYNHPSKPVPDHPCLVFQIQSFHESGVSLELVLFDDSLLKRRVYISTAFPPNSFESNELHAKVPWKQDNREIWTNLIVPLDTLTHHCFGRSFYRLESFQLRPCCKVRKIFLSSRELLNLPENIENYDKIKIPLALDFLPSVDHLNYQLSVGPSINSESASKVMASQAKHIENVTHDDVSRDLKLLRQKQQAIKASKTNSLDLSSIARIQKKMEEAIETLALQSSPSPSLPPAPLSSSSSSYRPSQTLQIAGEASTLSLQPSPKSNTFTSSIQREAPPTPPFFDAVPRPPSRPLVDESRESVKLVDSGHREDELFTIPQDFVQKRYSHYEAWVVDLSGSAGILLDSRMKAVLDTLVDAEAIYAEDYGLEAFEAIV